MTALFDAYLVVDWSARATPSPKRPSKDAIWIGVARAGSAGVEAHYLRTRAAAVDWLEARLRAEIAAGRRALVGFDFPFGYPVGVAERVTGAASALALWRWLADAIRDDAENASNRFDVAQAINRLYDGVGPFWGAPGGRDLPDLPARGSDRAGADHPPERRACERIAKGAKTVWQLMYAGSVGSQVLLGLPALTQLKARFGDDAAIWPFESGFAPPAAPVVLAEIYPSLFVAPSDASPAEIPDEAQVKATAAAYREFDEDGALSEMFEGPNVDAGTSAAERLRAEREEAWILGLGHAALAQKARAGAV